MDRWEPRTPKAPSGPGAPPDLKSFRFRKEREASWRELESLVDQVERSGLDSLDATDLSRLPALYRRALSSLSVARVISLDKGLLQYLETLAARGYLTVYGAKLGFWKIAWDFISERFPAEVRRMSGMLALASGTLLLGAVCGFALVIEDPARFYAYVDEGLAAGRGPTTPCVDLRSVLYSTGGAEELSPLAAYLFTHNSRIGMTCFALGFAAGIPVLMLLFTNGLMIGAFAAIYWRCGMSLSFWAWSMGHGVTELLAVCLCGAAGLTVGRAILLPGAHTRRAAAAIAGRRAALVVLGAVILFLIAGLIEGFFRQMVLDEPWRILMASSTALLWGAYFSRGGRLDEVTELTPAPTPAPARLEEAT